MSEADSDSSSRPISRRIVIQPRHTPAPPLTLHQLGIVDRPQRDPETPAERTRRVAQPVDSFLYSRENMFPAQTLPRARPHSNQSKLGKQVPRKPTVTVASALPKIAYTEQDDTKGTERTLEYIAVQRALLKYLETWAADTLSADQASKWTQAIEPITKEPKAKDAVRLCYYMRSQGFDTYAVIKNGIVSLFVVRQLSTTRGDGHDLLYWKQHVTTNLVHFYGPIPGRAEPMRMTEYSAQLRGGEAMPEPAVDSRQGTGPDISHRMLAALDTLDSLLRSNPQDPS